MITNIAFQPHQIQQYTEVLLPFSEQSKGFPLMSIDKDSYIVGAQIQSGINFDMMSGRHCLAIGKACSLAESITFMIDLNHDYGSVIQGEPSFLNDIPKVQKTNRKASVFIQNDVWVGHGATIMAGVTLRNGCVVAANAVVTKDVPPYAIVGGNPARVLRYRFEPEIIAALQKIAWWDWDYDIQWARKEDFALPAREFVKKYLSESEEKDIKTYACSGARKVVFFPADVEEVFPLYPKVFAEYFSKNRPNTELLIYLPEECSDQKYVYEIECNLARYEDSDNYVTLQVGVTLDERILFQGADYYITTRSRETVRRTCLADRYGTHIFYGTDEPIFFPDLI